MKRFTFEKYYFITIIHISPYILMTIKVIIIKIWWIQLQAGKLKSVTGVFPFERLK